MLHVALLLTLAQPQPADGVASRFGTEAASTCGVCHPRHFREWKHSVHSSVDRFLPLPEAAGEKSDFEDPACRGCHDDVTRILGLGASGHPVRLAHATERTITCTVCHQIEDPPGGRPPPQAPPHGDPAGEAGRYREQFHEAKPLHELRRAELCGPCHEVTTPSGLPIDRSYSQFLESVYPDRGLTCVDCHMVAYSGAMIPGGHFREELHHHDVIGSDVFGRPAPAQGPQAERVGRFLSAAVTLFVRVPEQVAAGRDHRLEVEIINSGAGHNFPVGPPGERRLWLEVEARLDDGRRIHSSGSSRRPAALLAAAETADVADADPDAVVFTDRYLDDRGEEVDFWFEATRVETRSLRALERRRLDIAIPVPADAAGQAVSFDVRLRFQACSPRRLARLGLRSLVDEYPVFDLHRHQSVPVPVVRRLRPPDWVRVPEDVRSIHEAIRRVPRGGTVSVRGGLYRLRRPIDFDGKDLRLVGRDGAERTVLALQTADKPPRRASVLVFTQGESAASVVEGFTIRGGQGTLLDGRRSGGGIFCRGASPTFRDNHVELNDALDGDGGAFFFLDSSSVVEGHRIERNRAGGDGGGIFVGAGSQVSVEGSLFYANRADGRGGGLCAAGDVNVSRTLIQANQAARGGGVATTPAGEPAPSSPPPHVFRNVFVYGNAAALGGGFHWDEDAAYLERVVIAGNAARVGGAGYVQGEARPLLVNLTVTENRAASRGAVRVADSGTPYWRNSIVWQNDPPGEVAGEVTHSLTDDPAHQDDSNIGGFPLFSRIPGSWEDCGDLTEPGCVPVRWSGEDPPQPIAYGRWVPGEYELILGSPAIDAGARVDPPDPDDSRRDLGAIPLLRPPHGFIRGDVDGDGEVTLSDAVDLRDLLERVIDTGSRQPLPCDDVADVDDSGAVDAADLEALFSFLFGLAPPPATPFPACGVDPTLGEGVGCHQPTSGCR